MMRFHFNRIMLRRQVHNSLLNLNGK